ncbi:hypothetical protein ACNOYE_08680 [Nannocystaceae bacterium ST9]
MKRRVKIRSIDDLVVTGQPGRRGLGRVARLGFVGQHRRQFGLRDAGIAEPFLEHAIVGQSAVAPRLEPRLRTLECSRRWRTARSLMQKRRSVGEMDPSICWLIHELTARSSEQPHSPSRVRPGGEVGVRAVPTRALDVKPSPEADVVDALDHRARRAGSKYPPRPTPRIELPRTSSIPGKMLDGVHGLRAEAGLPAADSPSMSRECARPSMKDNRRDEGESRVRSCVLQTIDALTSRHSGSSSGLVLSPCRERRRILTNFLAPEHHLNRVLVAHDIRVVATLHCVSRREPQSEFSH